MNEVKKFNFKFKQKYTQEQLKVFEIMRSKMSKLLARSLTEELNTNVVVTFDGVEQLTFDEFINNMGNKTLYVPYIHSNPKDTNLLYISTELAYISMDMLMGGDGNYCDTEKELTELDKKILKYIVTIIIECIFKFVKTKVKVDVESSIGNIEEGYLAQQNIYLEEIVVVSKYNVNIKGKIYKLGMCNYYSDRKTANLEIEQWIKNDDIENSNVNQSDNNLLSDNIWCIELNLTAKFGSAMVDIEDFLQLSKGDVIRLNTKLTNEIKVCIEDLETYYAKPGIRNGRKCALISNLVEKLVKEDE